MIKSYIFVFLLFLAAIGPLHYFDKYLFNQKDRVELTQTLPEITITCTATTVPEVKPFIKSSTEEVNMNQTKNQKNGALLVGNIARHEPPKVIEIDTATVITSLISNSVKIAELKSAKLSAMSNRDSLIVKGLMTKDLSKAFERLFNEFATDIEYWKHKNLVLSNRIGVKLEFISTYEISQNLVDLSEENNIMFIDLAAKRIVRSGKYLGEIQIRYNGKQDV